MKDENHFYNFNSKGNIFFFVTHTKSLKLTFNSKGNN